MVIKLYVKEHQCFTWLYISLYVILQDALSLRYYIHININTS